MATDAEMLEWFRNLSLADKEAVMARQNHLQIDKYLSAWGDNLPTWRKLLENGIFSPIDISKKGATE